MSANLRLRSVDFGCALAHPWAFKRRSRSRSDKMSARSERRSIKRLSCRKYKNIRKIENCVDMGSCQNSDSVSKNSDFTIKNVYLNCGLPSNKHELSWSKRSLLKIDAIMTHIKQPSLPYIMINNIFKLMRRKWLPNSVMILSNVFSLFYNRLC